MATQREFIRRHWLDQFAEANSEPALGVKNLTVKISRIAPRELDGDNLQGALKACRDEVAWLLGLPVKNEKKRIADDRDPRVTWEYGQRRGVPKEYAVEILIQEVD